MLTSRRLVLLGIVVATALGIALAMWLLSSRTPLLLSLSATGTDALPETLESLTLKNLTLVDSEGDEVRLGRRFTLTRENTFAVLERLNIPEGNYTAIELQFELEGELGTLSLGVPDNAPQNAPLALQASESAAGALLVVVDVNRSIVRRDSGRVFLPVLRLETREGLPVPETSNATIEGGVIRTNATFGTTEYGTLKQNHVAR